MNFQLKEKKYIYLKQLTYVSFTRIFLCIFSFCYIIQHYLYKGNIYFIYFIYLFGHYREIIYPVSVNRHLARRLATVKGQ